jgi:hypothetical protein
VQRKQKPIRKTSGKGRCQFTGTSFSLLALAIFFFRRYLAAVEMTCKRRVVLSLRNVAARNLRPSSVASSGRWKNDVFLTVSLIGGYDMCTTPASRASL